MALMAIPNQEKPSGITLDFSFLPYAYNSTAISQSVDSKPRQNLKTALRIQLPVPSPMRLPEIQTPLTPLDAPLPPTMSVAVATKPTDTTLLTIPLEIRLQIYSYVQLSHPIQHAHLSPITTSPTEPPYVKEEIHHTTFHPHPTNLNYEPENRYPFHLTHSMTTNISLPKPRDQNITFATATSHLLTQASISHPTITHPTTQTKLPTALLLSCRQIYAESHRLPFHTSHFAFVNWFWSGVYAARQFSRGLVPWQRVAMRWVSVEVLGRDMWKGGMERFGGGIGGLAGVGVGEGGRKVGEWVELCRLWKGVWGLRIDLKGGVLFEERKGGSESDGEVEKDFVSSEGRHKEAVPERGLLNTQLEWVKLGLLSMKQLRWMEIEIEDQDIPRDTKMRFCEDLVGVLNRGRDRSDGWMGKVKVILVERVKIEKTTKVSNIGELGPWALEA